MKSLAIILICLFCCTGCQKKSIPLKPMLENEGAVFVYFQPFPQAAERLTFSVEGLSALRDDGMEFSLPFTLAVFKGKEMRRQRLIASGALPPGEYIGLACTVKGAALKSGDGEAALLLPDEPVRINVLFKVNRKKALVLALSFNYAESVRSGYRFTPIFSAFVPDRPVMGVIGYAANYGSNTITVFDKAKMEAAGAIATSDGPRMIVLDQARRRAYAAVPAEDAVEVIDTAEGDVINRIRLNIGDAPQELALTPDGGILITANAGSDTVSIIDTASFLELGRIRVGQSPRSVLMDRAGRRAFAFNTLSNTISVIDVPNRSLVTSVPTEPEPLRGQFNRQGDRLYVIFGGSPYLVVLDPASLVVVRREFVGMGMQSIKVDTRTDLFYLARRQEPSVAVYDPLSFTPGDYIRTEGPVSAMAIDGDGNNLYLVIPERKAVTIVNLVSRKTLSEIDVSESPSWVTMMGER